MSFNQRQIGHCSKSIEIGNKWEKHKFVTIKVQKREKQNNNKLVTNGKTLNW
jgi:hypothetical protein